MKTSIIALLATTAASAMILAAPQAHAAIGFRFLPEQLTPAQIRDRIITSNKIDPTGHAPLMDGECKHNRDACAEPIHYLEMFQKADPDAGLTNVNQLPDYISSLVEIAPPEGEYEMACIELSPDNKYIAVATCEERTFKPGEKVYARKIVGKDGKINFHIVLAGFCKNPVMASMELVVAASPCDYIKTGVKTGDHEQIGADLDDVKLDHGKCFGVELPGEKIFSPLARTCSEDVKCDLPTVDGLTLMGSYKVKEGGEVTIRVPGYYSGLDSKARILLCDKKADGTKSCGQFISHYSYRSHQLSATLKAPTAYIVYSGEQKADEPGVVWHWGTECPKPKSM